MGLIQDDGGRLWIATLGGVSVFDGSSFTNYTEAEGLASDTVLRVFQDRMGYLWFATWGGINRFDGEVFQTLNRQDGLAGSTAMAFLEDREGWLWFGTTNGITRCHLPPPSPPPVFIRSVVADRRYENPARLAIPASWGLTAFEFHAINFKTRPGAMVYRYRLKGHDQKWQTTHVRRVEYQDLEPGVYAFQVTAVDRDLNYSMPARVEVEVVPDVRDEKIDELEERVRERTRELQEKNTALEEALIQLREMQHQLVVQEKMATLGSLVAGIAHELNNPLGAVKSAGDVLGRGVEKIRRTVDQTIDLSEIRDDRPFDRALSALENSIQVTNAAIERITQIVDSLKSFTRLDQADYQRADPHEGLESTLTLLEYHLKDGISIVREYGELPQIYCFPGELNQVFMNVLMNASQAIEGEGAIKIRTYRDETQVYVEISDTGRGVPRERLQRIFDPNFSRKDTRVGLGLGLATSYNIVRQHQGHLRLESERGAGTVVTISLPIGPVRTDGPEGSEL